MAAAVLSPARRSYVDYVAYTETLNRDLGAVLEHLARSAAERGAAFPPVDQRSVQGTVANEHSRGRAHRQQAPCSPAKDCLAHYEEDQRLFGACKPNVTEEWETES